MKNTNYNIRISPELKAQAEVTFGLFGLNLSEAITVFLHKAVMAHGFPFPVTCAEPNAETLAALQEADDIIHGRVYAKRYTSMEELLADWRKEDEEDEILD